MRRLVFLCSVAALCPALLTAGPIYGAIFFDNGSPVRRASITVTCNGSNAGSGTTRDDGSYRIDVRQEGRCAFTVTSLQGSPNAVVFSYPTAAQYDFVAVPGAGGNYALRRR